MQWQINEVGASKAIFVASRFRPNFASGVVLLNGLPEAKLERAQACLYTIQGPGPVPLLNELNKT